MTQAAAQRRTAVTAGTQCRAVRKARWRRWARSWRRCGSRFQTRVPKCSSCVLLPPLRAQAGRRPASGDALWPMGAQPQAERRGSQRHGDRCITTRAAAGESTARADARLLPRLLERPARRVLALRSRPAQAQAAAM